MTRIRMHEGRPRHLCESCNWGRVAKTDLGQRLTDCSMLERAHAIHGDVAQCSKYEFAFSRAEYSIERIAWIVDRDKKTGGVIGFTPPEKEK